MIAAGPSLEALSQRAEMLDDFQNMVEDIRKVGGGAYFQRRAFLKLIIESAGQYHLGNFTIECFNILVSHMPHVFHTKCKLLF